MGTEDRRIRKTQAALAKALVDLAQQEPYEAITIKAITDRADVGYATFFRHYVSKDELLMDILEDTLDDLSTALPKTIGEHQPEESGHKFFQYILDHETTSRLLLGAMRTPGIEEKVAQFGIERFGTPALPSGMQDIPSAIIANHLVMSTIALVRWWIEQPAPRLVPATMGTILTKLIIAPMRALEPPKVKARS